MRSTARGYSTRRQKLSIQTQVSPFWTLPIQGDWYKCFTAVTVMSDTAGLIKAKGTLIHCRQEKQVSMEKEMRRIQENPNKRGFLKKYIEVKQYIFAGFLLHYLILMRLI